MTRLPTLITCRSAIELRDEGIRYANLRAGMLSAILAGLAAATGPWWLREAWISYPLLAAATAGAGVVAYFCGSRAEFPHTPRLTLAEMEAMRDDLQLSPGVLQQTYGAVLHGSFDEHRAIETADNFLNRIKTRKFPMRG